MRLKARSTSKMSHRLIAETRDTLEGSVVASVDGAVARLLAPECHCDHPSTIVKSADDRIGSLPGRERAPLPAASGAPSCARLPFGSSPRGSALPIELPASRRSGSLRQVVTQYQRAIVKGVMGAVEQGHRAIPAGVDQRLPPGGIGVELFR